jgi:molybdopterin converting factor small subunit
MQVEFKYFAQVRKTAAGAESERIELPDGTDLVAALGELARKHGEDFRNLVLDAAGAVRPSIMVLVDGAPAARGKPCPLKDGSEVSILSPVAGG